MRGYEYTWRGYDEQNGWLLFKRLRLVLERSKNKFCRIMSLLHLLKFCLRRVYHCPCLLRIVNLLKDAEICKLDDILTVLAK